MGGGGVNYTQNNICKKVYYKQYCYKLSLNFAKGDTSPKINNCIYGMIILLLLLPNLFIFGSSTVLALSIIPYRLSIRKYFSV